jgi:opacity protein-like surface antigen
MTSTVLQEGQSSFSGLAIRARLQPPSLSSHIEIMPTIEWWRNSNTIKPYGISTTRKDATLGVDGRWNFGGSTFKPYLGAGIGLHFLSNRVSAPSLGLNNATDSVTKGGLALLGGVSFALSGRFENFLDLKYHHVTDYRQLKINWGITYNL